MDYDFHGIYGKLEILGSLLFFFSSKSTFRHRIIFTLQYCTVKATCVSHWWFYELDNLTGIYQGYFLQLCWKEIKDLQKTLWCLVFLFSCAFPDIIPNRLLWHALEAFNKQSRKAEDIKKSMLAIFELIMPKAERHIQKSLQDMLMVSDAFVFWY